MNCVHFRIEERPRGFIRSIKMLSVIYWLFRVRVRISSLGAVKYLVNISRKILICDSGELSKGEVLFMSCHLISYPDSALKFIRAASAFCLFNFDEVSDGKRRNVT